MKSFDELWKELRKDFDFKLNTYSEGSVPYEYSYDACEMVYNAVLKEVGVKKCMWTGKEEYEQVTITKIKKEEE